MKREWLRGCGRNRLREKGRSHHSLSLSFASSSPISLSLSRFLSRQGYASKTITAPRRRTLDRAPLVSCSAAPHTVGAFFGLWRRARITAASPLDALSPKPRRKSRRALFRLNCRYRNRHGDCFKRSTQSEIAFHS